MPATPPCPRADDWQRHLLGQLPEADSVRLDQHLACCAACLGVVTSLRTPDRLFETICNAVRAPHVVDETVDEAFIERLCRLHEGIRVADEQVELADLLGPPEGADEIGRVGPYGILRVLGKGGMGIVFAARQDRPRRVIALKMLLASAHTHRDRLERFRAESETLARLNHPQVVRVLDVGEYQGRPYFTTEYAEGGSLAQKLVLATLPPRATAELVEGLARAVAAAHAQGIIHRDLKPSNVLLSGDGTPLIADFGLAKQLVGAAPAAAQTETGAILGTPNYMAPEQASGHNEDVGPPTDVYALGAILYECLTGRPPFKAATLLDTLEQVRSQEPVPPRRLQPTAPRDLETICLACLKKKPTERYVSAAALADDLEHWLAGEPIRARRASSGERLWKWARRRPGMAALVGLCLAFVVTLFAGGMVYERRLRAALKKAQDEGERADENYQQALAQGTRADENYKEARETLRKLVQRSHDHRWHDLPRVQQLQREQAEDALAFYDKVARQQTSDPIVRQDVAHACLEAGKLQLTLSQLERALELLRRADRLSDAALRDAPDDREATLLRADVLRTLGQAMRPATGSMRLGQTRADALRNLGKVKEDEEATLLVEQAVELLETLRQKHPTDRTVRQQLAGIHVILGGWSHLANKNDEAERRLLRAVQLYDGLLRERPGERGDHIARAGAQVSLAAAYRHQGKGAEMAQHNREAEVDLEQAIATDPPDPVTLQSLAVLRINGAYDFSAKHQHEEALAYVTRNVAMLEAALKREPDHADLRDALRRTHGVRATMLDALKRYPECVKVWEQMMAYASPADAASARFTLVQLLRRAGELNRAIAEADTLRLELTRSPSAAGWKSLGDRYQELADDAGKDSRLSTEERRQLQERLRAAGREAIEQSKKVQKKQK
jgi:tetratricopeptide (TPR) repeat protein